MEASIVENDNLTRFKIRDQTTFKIRIEDIGCAVAFEAKRAVQSSSAKRGDDRCSSGAVAGLFGIEPLAAFGPAAIKPYVVINPRFIDINKLFDRDIGNQATELPAFGFIAFLVAEGLFLKVYLSCLSRFQIITPLTPKCRPISVNF